ncbi:MAG: DUF3604 domain-containing protein [Pseudomonadales bacterium]
MTNRHTLICLFLCLLGNSGLAFANEQTVLLWGDTHLHTNYSFDAFLFMNRTADPDTAYRYAKGLPVVHPYHRARIQIETPLDFLVVSDHAELTSVPLRIFDGDERIAQTQLGKYATSLIKEGKGNEVFSHLVAAANSGDRSMSDELEAKEIREVPWHKIAAAADRHNEPNKFTALIGWEWSSLPDAANLHRVVFMDEDAIAARKFLPFSSNNSDQPEDLWAWLEKTSAQVNAKFVSIPHNMNISKGRMFPLEDSAGKALDADYANTRIKWEPVAEVTQIKGDSETHSLLSPNDEFADFETYRFLIDTRPDTDHTATVTPGDYARSALMRGLELENSIGVNPYKFGMIGSTDSHTGMASAEENNFHGKMALDSVPEKKSEPRIGKKGAAGWDMSASGLAAVWASENTREAIVAAFKRKEVYATTGPRIQVRFFGGWKFKAGDARAKDLAARGYKKGVSMGGDLNDAPRGKAPSFLLQAARDPKGANLDRIQIVKGWTDANGKAVEKVYDVKTSDNRKPNTDGKLPVVGNTVDLQRATYSNDIGATQLAAAWTDPDFDPKQRAFYYARAIEIPTPRHSLYDAVALQIEHSKDRPATIQERAYSSPIWYSPGQ